MAGHAAPWTIAIREILSDGQWHKREEVIAQAGLAVPPGRAMREREKGARRQLLIREPAKPMPRRKAPSDDHSIAVGRRMIVVSSLPGLAGIEQRTDEQGIRWLRSTPTPKESHH